jgi:uncharacterized protein YPO0396
LNETAQIDFAAEDSLTGFRLLYMELLNWGTFHRHVWRIEPEGRNALLTGDIGSGKSTLVDAVTTLLVPHHRIVFNKAAGAEGKERSLYSYIRGEYKSEQDAFTQGARAVTLRNENSYTVLLVHFHNQGFDQGATLAQVFWLKDGKTNPERFFVVAEARLTIAEHFSGFGSDILDLKKRLRKTPRVTVLDNFREYATRFRHLFGIQQEKALDLFYQTVSMKSVGNLTEFVRLHMLEKPDMAWRIEELRRAFDNLNRAHEAVLKAKAQIEQLQPLVADGHRHAELSFAILDLQACREALEPWFAAHQVRLTERLIQRLEDEIASIERRLETLKAEINDLRVKEDTLKSGIEDHGGSRLRAIDQETARLVDIRDRRHALDSRYRGYLGILQLEAVTGEETFQANRRQAEMLLQELERKREQLDRSRTDLAVDLRQLKQQGVALESELQSLRSRRSNIPLRNLEIRREMVETLQLDEDTLPFVGELLQVDETQARWEGAIERVLHNFGLSLLVPDALYAQVSHYVDRTHLSGRLVYYRVRAETQNRISPISDSHALPRKLHIKPDSPFYVWLETWIAEHFNYICCEDLATFRRLPKAITDHGQIKTGGRRHEKDDRYALEDRSHYVLGWSNEGKIMALEARLKPLAEKIVATAQQQAELDDRLQELNRKRDVARDMLQIVRFDDIDWHQPAREIETLQEEKRQIEDSSDTLKDLRMQLGRVQRAIQNMGDKADEAQKQLGKLEGRRESAHEELDEARDKADTTDESTRQKLYPTLERFLNEALPEAPLTLQNIDKCHTKVRDHIQRRLDNERDKRERVRDRLIKQMQAYKHDYPAETMEVDASIEALSEYKTMLTTLETEDLPRHEARFRDMLKEDTINSVAMFQGQLERERQEIGEKIDAINRSLREIEYQPGTYIRLQTDPSQDPEIRDFRQELRQCLSRSLGTDELYTEEKFLQVKTIIDRFNGREGLVDQDRRWTHKVTDVRNWFNFSASERYGEDDTEREFYSDTAGKSGGQKEKLAYTILASALAYQFGLEWNNVRSRSFRFVVIDEAFGRGSDESTRYALELFKKLNLQLLIVTPLQKIHIIENYISAVHFIHNEGGHNSVIRNLTVEEYRAEKARYLMQAGMSV